MRFAPDWVLALTCSVIANRYIGSHIPIEAFSNKLSQGLEEQYVDLTSDKLSEVSEGLMRFLVTIESDDHPAIFDAFIFSLAHFDASGKKRRIKGMFGSALEATEKETNIGAVLKLFKAFVFKLRSDPDLAPSKPWQLDKVKGMAELSKLLYVDVSIEDA
jgi:hypothetical protein